ncbi:DUF5688 family protein [Butyrivibrio sp. AE3004]|uniref:DUF5688 family protein n=1 Tax=Butyrivibrio sp. AE3004 TaxID=1506994 RepID=UPI000494B353|nr:DUF5688 family protein [Butyrivibrio sp. AE3004]
MNKAISVADFIDFKNVVVRNILGYLSSEYENSDVELKEVIKNNGTRITGLLIKKAGANIAPNIYLEEFYSDLENGKSLEDVLREIAEVREKHEVSSMDVSFLADWEKCRDKVIPRLINAGLNSELLMERPHRMIEDLAVIYVVDLSDNMSVPVTEKIIDTWGVDEEMLYESSMRNLPNILPGKLQTLGEVIRKMMPVDDFEGMNMFPANDVFYVLSNERNCYGAASLLIKSQMDSIAEKIGDYYILPSSVHELIIIPDDGRMQARELVAMVKEVNMTSVSEQDKLSDSVYRYEFDKGLKKVDISANVA